MYAKTKIDLEEDIKTKYRELSPNLDEKSRRAWAATEAKTIGPGGISIVYRATGITYKTIKKGLNDINEKPSIKKWIRSKGGGRKTLIEKDELLEGKLKEFVESSTRGDPESPLLWTSKSTYNLRDELNGSGHTISQRSVSTILRKMGYSLQGNRKTQEGGDHPDRDEQFKFIYRKVKRFQKENSPVISVDTKKKENIGNFKNEGKEHYQKASSPEVNVYDFIDKEQGKVAPYGIYDLSKNNGWVSVGISSDTSQFAVNSISTWWEKMGKSAYPKAKKLYINADGGGSNGWRNRLWKTELQSFSTRTGLVIHVSHFPPGTSKWNKIEHRMFSFITKNWRGRPLLDRATVVNLIASTKTKNGLIIRAALDENSYEKGIIITDEVLAKVKLRKNKFHGEWNYEVHPLI